MIHLRFHLGVIELYLVKDLNSKANKPKIFMDRYLA
jgi:hypothetical protein